MVDETQISKFKILKVGNFDLKPSASAFAETCLLQELNAPSRSGKLSLKLKRLISVICHRLSLFRYF
jgi:hypothetical protein